MTRTVLMAALVLAGTTTMMTTTMTTMAQAQDRGLAQGTQGRPHGGNFAESMMLRRHHMTRMQYNAMRRHASMRRRHAM